MEFQGRKIVFKALVGSHNYNLNTETSDEDYKIFLLPTYNDLYFGKSFSSSNVGKEIDYDYHDIRKCSSLWYKANVNFLEVLFSKSIIIDEDLNSESKEILAKVFAMKDEIAKMNLPYLYDACIGMYHNKMKYLEKGTEGTRYLVDTYGYDTKQALGAWRILDFLRAFADTDFNDFGKAIWYSEENSKRNFLLDLKKGKFTLNEFKDTISGTLNHVESEFKIKYKSQKLNEETNEKLLELLKELIKINI